ncbi:MAG TPA: AI-2E family transporter [Acidimicrobiia bacterium]
MADGRRSEGHEAELLRSVFVILAGALAFIVGVVLFWELRRIVGLIVMAAFFAIILNPMVDVLTRLKLRRGIATGIVFLLGVAAFSGLIYTFVRPIYGAGQSFATDIPGFVERARNGEGRVGELVKKYNIDKEVAENAPRLQEALRNSGGPAVRTAQRVASGLFALLTIMVLSFLMLLEAPGIISAFLGLLSPKRALQVRRIGSDVAGAVTGYMAGNLVICLIAGTATWIFLSIVGVPFAGVLGLWVGFADLLPLVGATIGAIPTIAIAFLHSTGAGIAVLIFYIVYQQIENHFLQPVVMSRTVKLNPLGVLLSVLVGVELAGFVGALLAIPAAGAIQVVIRDLWDERQQRLKPVPTVGVDETPITGIPVLSPPETHERRAQSE